MVDKNALPEKIIKAISKISEPGIAGLAFGMIMSRLGIVVTKSVKTFAVTSNGYFLANPDWYNDHVIGRVREIKDMLSSYYSDEAIEKIVLYFLILHEAYHITAGHIFDIASVNTPEEEELLNIAMDRWANKFAAETLMNASINKVTKNGEVHYVIADVVNDLVKLSEGDWNTFTELVLGKGFVTDNLLAKEAEKLNIRVPNFDTMTSKEIFNWLIELKTMTDSSRNKLTFGDNECSSFLSKAYKMGDVIYQYNPNENDKVYRDPSDDFKKAKSREDLEKAWSNILSEAQAIASGVGRGAGGFAKAFTFEKKKSIVDWKKALLASITSEYAVEVTESPIRFDEIYELMKEADPIIDKDVYMYGTEHLGHPPAIFSTDTSSSTIDLLPDVSNELNSLLNSKKIRGVIKVDWDAAIENVTFMKKVKDNAVDYKGFGGTSPIPFFQMLLKVRTEDNEEYFDNFWRLFRRYKARKFVIFMSDFEFFDDDAKESMKLLSSLERKGWTFVFINAETKTAIYAKRGLAVAFKKIGHF